MKVESAPSQAASYQKLVQTTSDFYDSMQKAADLNLQLLSVAIDTQRSTLDLLKTLVAAATEKNPITDMTSANMKHALSLLASWQPK